jgi:hypothetical protein
MFGIRTSVLTLVVWLGLTSPSSLANCGSTSQQAEDLALEKLPASLQSLAKEIQGKTGDDIESAITSRFGSGRDESRSDIFVSTLRKAIEAGGKLDIRAKFPAGEVRIRQFGALAGRRRPRSGATPPDVGSIERS